jgi:hypothetical protein
MEEEEAKQTEPKNKQTWMSKPTLIFMLFAASYTYTYTYTLTYLLTKSLTHSLETCKISYFATEHVC